MLSFSSSRAQVTTSTNSTRCSQVGIKPSPIGICQGRICSHSQVSSYVLLAPAHVSCRLQQHQKTSKAPSPAAATPNSDAAAEGDEAQPHQSQQHASLTPDDFVPLDGVLHQQQDDELHGDDDLSNDDNVILLLGSEDEDEGEVYDDAALYLSDDFAVAMAAARQQLLSSSGSDDDGAWDGEEDWATPSSEDFWSTEKERVFLVGVSYKQQQQQQQRDRQQQQSSSPQRARGLFDLSSSRRSSLAPAAAAADGNQGRSSSRQKQGARRVSYTVHESIDELGRLAETAGLQVVGSTYQVLEAPNPATYIGSGKVAEVAAAVQATKADTVVFDDELSPGQLRNLEKAFSGKQGGRQVAVADRTALILDIFSQRARTKEGKLQVDLAQTEYQLPRLTRMWTHLDRVSGGGQVKGAGEKQIEIDKRLLRDKAAALRRELEAVRTHRAAHRTRRQDAPIPVAALVGYTNAGKSTLLNTLTAAGVLAEDKLFATLDPTTRKVRLSGNLEVLFSDTVGFIQKLPTQLVAAFRATLEEIAAASVVVHVLDVSAPNSAAQCSAVLQVLDEIGVQDLPIITAWNKIDACDDPEAVRALAASRPDVVIVSGVTGEGLKELLEQIALKLAESMVDMEVLLPYSEGALLDELHKMGKVSDTSYTELGTVVSASVPRCLAGKLESFATPSSSSSSSNGKHNKKRSSTSRPGDGAHESAHGNNDDWQQQQQQQQHSVQYDIDLVASRSSSSSVSSL